MQKAHKPSAIEMPESIRFVFDVLNRNGFSVYLVGGCVRDSIMGAAPKDWDIASSAQPSQIKSLFEKTYDTGIKHGTVTVSVCGERFEVTTFRVDGEYKDSRRPESVMFSSDIEDDLRRRDFTINAIAYNPQSGFTDPFGGINDISRGIIRGVGVPSERFGEDALRMLRAVRFAARLGFKIERETKNAIIENAELLKNISAERIREEIMSLLTSASVDIVFSKEFICLAEIISKPLSSSICADKSLLRGLLRHCKPDPILRFSALISCMNDDCADALVSSLKFSKKDSLRILTLHKIKDMYIGEYEIKRENVARALCEWGEQAFLDYLYYQMLCCVAEDEALEKPSADLEHRINYVIKLEAFYNQIVKNNFPVYIKDLALNGYDLKMKFKISGEFVGKTLKKLLDYVHSNPEKNTPAELSEKAYEIITKDFT